MVTQISSTLPPINENNTLCSSNLHTPPFARDLADKSSGMHCLTSAQKILRSNFQPKLWHPLLSYFQIIPASCAVSFNSCLVISTCKSNSDRFLFTFSFVRHFEFPSNLGSLLTICMKSIAPQKLFLNFSARPQWVIWLIRVWKSFPSQTIRTFFSSPHSSRNLISFSPAAFKFQNPTVYYYYIQYGSSLGKDPR